jgi:hypothetical protein
VPPVRKLVVVLPFFKNLIDSEFFFLFKFEERIKKINKIEKEILIDNKID